MVAASGDKIAVAALRSWATAATALAKASLDENTEKLQLDGRRAMASDI